VIDYQMLVTAVMPARLLLAQVNYYFAAAPVAAAPALAAVVAVAAGTGAGF
jgi:hypothetical protein